MGAIPRLAELVEIQHLCHCETAIEAPKDDKCEVHVFTVDGEEFPWHISERGPSIRRLAEELYAVRVELLVAKDGMRTGFVHDTTSSRRGIWSQPALGGITIPWYISEQGFTYLAKGKHMPVLIFEFMAKRVEANITIKDERPDHDNHDIDSYDGDIHQVGREYHEVCARIN